MIRKIATFYKSLAMPALIFGLGYFVGCFATGMMVGIGGLS